MTRGIWTKWIIGAAFLLLIVAVGCILYYQYTTAADKQAAEQADKLLQQWEADKAKPTTTVEKEETDIPAESTTPTAEKPTHEKNIIMTEDIQDVESETPSETATLVDVLMSPYGFGPYPELPPDYPGAEDPKFWTYQRTVKNELMTRVCIKLWKQGKRTHGASFENGLVYPVYPNTLIIKWKTEETPFGTRKVAVRAKGSPETEDFQRSFRVDPPTEDDIPSYITVIDFEDAGIDPYEFLDLDK